MQGDDAFISLAFKASDQLARGEGLGSLDQEEIVGRLISSEEEDEKDQQANLLRLFVTAEMAKAVLTEECAPDIRRRVLWALGETHSTEAIPVLEAYLGYKDDKTFGVALTALAKVDPERALELVSRLEGNSSPNLRRRIEDIHTYLLQYERGITLRFARVDDFDLVESTMARLESIAGRARAEHERMPAVVGDLAGIWSTYVLPVLVGVGSNILFAYGRHLVTALRDLRQARERPIVNARAAALIARTTLASDDLEFQALQFQRVVQAWPGMFYPDLYGRDPVAYIVEFWSADTRLLVFVATDGEVSQIERLDRT